MFGSHGGMVASATTIASDSRAVNAASSLHRNATYVCSLLTNVLAGSPNHLQMVQVTSAWQTKPILTTSPLLWNCRVGRCRQPSCDGAFHTHRKAQACRRHFHHHSRWPSQSGSRLCMLLLNGCPHRSSLRTTSSDCTQAPTDQPLLQPIVWGTIKWIDVFRQATARGKNGTPPAKSTDLTSVM